MGKWLAWIFGLAALIWSGVWLLGATATERVSQAWLDQRAEAGWTVAYDAVQTHGFPLRFNTGFTGVDLADPFTGIAWQAEDFRLVQDAWQPQAVRAVFPSEQVLATPFERLHIATDRMEALLHLRPTANLALARAEIDLSALRITSDRGWHSALEGGRFDVVEADAQEARYRVRFTAGGFTPAGEILRLLDPEGRLPAAIETLDLEAAIRFDRVWDMRALEEARPQFRHIALTGLEARWGDLSLHMSGGFDVVQAVPEGVIDIRAENWREMITLGVNAGLVPPAMQSALETGLAVVANLSGRPEDLEVSLRFEDGQAYLGPIPLGPAPYFFLY